MKARELTIEGMSCSHCVMHVQKELSKVEGLRIQSVEIGKAKVEIDENIVTDARMAQAIEQAGYKLIS